MERQMVVEYFLIALLQQILNHDRQIDDFYLVGVYVELVYFELPVINLF